MINELKDLQKLFKLCRAANITEFKMNGVEIKFSEQLNVATISPAQELEEEMPSDEDMAFYSSDAGQEFLDKKVGIR